MSKKAGYSFLRGCSFLTLAALAPEQPLLGQTDVQENTAAAHSDTEIQARVAALLAKMTPEEKAGQLFNIVNFGPVTPALEQDIASGKVGAIAYTTDAQQINRLQKLAVNNGSKIPLLFVVDVIHGFRTIFPVPIGLAASWDTAMVERVQASAAAEARASGIHWTYSPNVDIARDSRWGRMVEGAGEDPYLGSAMAAAQVRGFQGPYVGAPGHIIAGPKHFAGYGAAPGGRDYEAVDLSDSELWNVYLPPFKAAVDAGAYNIMSAYMPLNGVPAAANHWLLTDVLRKSWGFKGFVVTDAVSVPSLITHGLAVDRTDAAVRAIKAGVAMELGLPDGAYPGVAVPIGGSALATLPDAVRRGLISQSNIDEATRQVLEAKIRMGLFEKPYVDEAAATRAFADPKRRELARVAAERSAVLLRNESALLPLDRKRLNAIAVIGPLANSAVDTEGPWVFKPKADAVTILEGLKRKAGKHVRIDYVQGIGIPPRPIPSQAIAPAPPFPALDETAGIAQAVEAAKRADVAVVVVGERLDMIGENASRSTLDLPGRQQELLDAVVGTGKPVIVLLMNGRPLDLKETKAAAILDLWYPGSEGGTAAANLLFGDATPGGKLPFSWPRNVGQLPIFYSRYTTHNPDAADKRYWDKPSSPLYPFGHGLSYSTFDYSDLKIDRSKIAPGEPANVSFTIRNTGSRPAEDVAQLYIHQRTGAARPVRELKGFQRVLVQPGKSRLLTFRIDPQDLRYWSSATRGWVQDEAAFDVWVGGSSNASLSGKFEVTKSAAVGSGQ